MIDLIISFIYGFLFSTCFFEFILINFIYLSNIDLFLDLILFPKKRDKLIRHILNHYYIDNFDIIMYKE